MNPDVQDMQKMIANSNYVIGGKYMLGGTQSLQTNPFAAMYAAGYSTYTSRQLQFDAGVNFNLDKVLRGLSFKTHAAIDYATSYSSSIQNDYSTYEPVWTNMNGKDEIIGLNKYGTDKRSGTKIVSGSKTVQTVFFSGQFDYNRQFGLHALDATLLAHGYQVTTTGEYHRTSNANLGLNVDYNYDRRYYANLAMAAIHSAKLAEGHREALSPVGTIAWRISREKWMKPTESWLDDLKINASYGVINEDLDIEKYYMYDDIFTATGTWWGWSESANAMQTSDSQRGGNKDLGFVKRKELRFGLDASFGKGLVRLNANYYNVKFDGLLITPETLYPSYFHTYYPVSTFLPYINYNAQRRSGFDLTIDVHKQVGDVDLSGGIAGMTYTSKNTKISENVEYDWQKSQGARIDALRGYRCLGFITEDDVVRGADGKITGYKDGMAVINSNTKPGDLKYKDMNGDGLIDSRDQVVLGHWTPNFYLGVHFTTKYKGFTFFMNWTGNFGGMGVKDNSYMWCYGSSKYSDVVLGRWTPETATTATYPRLTTEGGELNFVTSDFWTYKTDAVRLNKVQLTYDLPENLFQGKWVKGLCVYLSGSNLLTISGERKYMETNVGSFPQTRFYNLGAKVNF